MVNQPPHAVLQESLAVSPFSASLRGASQLAENSIDLSLAFASLEDRFKHKFLVCHCCKKTLGIGVGLQSFTSFTSFTSFASSLATCHYSSSPALRTTH